MTERERIAAIIREETDFDHPDQGHYLRAADRILNIPPDIDSIRSEREYLLALANMLERPPLDDVYLEKNVARRCATAIRTVLSAPVTSTAAARLRASLDAGPMLSEAVSVTSEAPPPTSEPLVRDAASDGPIA